MRSGIAAELIASQVAIALAEDLGNGDLTAALIPPDAQAQATVISREAAVLCGQEWFDAVFAQLDTTIQINWSVQDGSALQAGQTLCTLSGPARAILSGERTALNFLQSLSGTATLAQRYVQAVAGTGVRILDTRKTLPGLRLAQKYAVRCGGASNHRVGLYDGILIKENHIMAAGGIHRAVAQARQHSPGMPVEVEVESLDELHQALDAGAEAMLLDNMSLATLAEAVTITAGRARLEASGGVNLDTIHAIAQTGVNDISVGELTKHLRAIDLSMRFGTDCVEPETQT
ncbi:MAG: carboxylating nicotinate-nucleotide diphosphorylase [Gammaproteobacteria bacterium]|nr:carboxylating nicotinate-nucleotide diphosphorylase [Gammaproteobacteria bacterium]